VAINLASGYARLLDVTQHSFSRTQQSWFRSWRHLLLIVKSETVLGGIDGVGALIGLGD
jgi:hypothetical protein